MYNNEKLLYIEHTLYKLDKTKIAFKNHYQINKKLFQLTFNYPKFYTMIYFVQCIWNYSSTINYDIRYIEIVHKYFYKIFYKKTNKKKYDLQNLEYIICHIKIMTLQDAILIAKVLVRSAKKNLNIKVLDIEVTWVSSAINVLLKYN